MDEREPIMRFFEVTHPDGHELSASKQISYLAEYIHETMPRNPERSIALRKLLEAKDAFLRGYAVARDKQ